jgi:hypothetical protein
MSYYYFYNLADLYVDCPSVQMESNLESINVESNVIPEHNSVITSANKFNNVEVYTEPSSEFVNILPGTFYAEANVNTEGYVIRHDTGNVGIISTTGLHGDSIFVQLEDLHTIYNAELTGTNLTGIVSSPLFIELNTILTNDSINVLYNFDLRTEAIELDIKYVTSRFVTILPLMAKF